VSIVMKPGDIKFAGVSQGDFVGITFDVVSEDGSPYDLTGKTIFFAVMSGTVLVRNSGDDSGVAAPDVGKLRIEIPGSQTKDLSGAVACEVKAEVGPGKLKEIVTFWLVMKDALIKEIS